MKWIFNNNRPIYAQLVEQMQVGILTGEYPPGSSIPSVRTLAVEAEVNPNTMQKALAELEREQLVFSQRTSGRFVTEDRSMIEEAKLELAKMHMQNFLREMQKLGYGKEEVISMINQKTKEGGYDAGI